MLKYFLKSLPRSYIKSSKLSIFSKHVPCSAIQTIWKPTFLFSDAPKDNDSASTFKFDLNKKLAENIDINVEEKIISAKNGDKTISYQLGDEVKGATLGDNDRYIIMMTCQVCNHKMTKTFTKKAYHTGVVIINCDNCDNNHLIADNLGWFREKSVNIEDLAQEKGDQAIKVQNHPRLQQILKGLKFVGNKDTILPENENHAEKENVENQGKVFEIEDVQKQSNEKK